ncbi:hypothetical protein PINS_up022379 [Pythium insidiosum]|nr:hypothetical protein PINS_up022379 [Pythium insidiosum]
MELSRALFSSHSSTCASCEARQASLRAEDDDTLHRRDRVFLSLPAKHERLTRFLAKALALALTQTTPGFCDGCEHTIATVARFLKRRQHTSLGLI